MDLLLQSSIFFIPNTRSDVPPHNRFKWTPSSLVYTDAAQIYDTEQDLLTTSQPVPLMTDSVIDFEEMTPDVHDNPEKRKNQSLIENNQNFSTEKSLDSINKDNNILKSNEPITRSSDKNYPIFDPPFNDLDTTRRKRPTTKPPSHKSSSQSIHPSLTVFVLQILLGLKTSSAHWR